MVDLNNRRLLALLIGRDPLLRKHVWREVWKIDRVDEPPLYAFGTIDIAVWDFTAKLAGLPLEKVIGVARDPVSAHASTITFRDTATFLDVADQCLGHGFRAIELHAWGVPIKDALLGQDLRAQVG